ncbi:MAG TPA: acetyl-CoA carboxylase biotin carboxyl carrier protein [Rhizomicrobium sp.]|jgi:acetyl-CoA carboxylase biotin carboxyl carrier protein|nr:acetyl-CoA carboxylase biotin carboxyl carrier protein [Rhizomicrobium sp.]
MNMKDMKQLGARLATGGKAKPPFGVDAGAIRELAELLDETGLAEIEIEQGGCRIRVARQAAAAPTGSHAPLPAMSEPPGAPGQAPLEGPAAKRDGAISSPMVGTVYVAPEPGKPPFVKIGDTVREGDTLLIVEAMKTMNPIIAPRSGIVKEICVEDAQPIEFGQTLLVLS